MQAIKRILVVIDPTREDNVALVRSRLIAAFIGAELHLLACENRHDHKPLLAELCAGLEAAGVTASYTQTWHANLTETIVHTLRAEGCGLVIKQHLPDNPLKKALLTPDDWKLLRYCPAPVLLVKDSASWMHGNVLAAVDLGNHDDQHHVLHDTIVSHAADIADMINGQMHLISAHPAPMLSAANPVYQLRENIVRIYTDKAARYRDQYNIPESNLHIDEGPADTLIPKVAQQIGASVTVIGTVARTGISGALIGNTAEVVLDQLGGDVLVLKPDDMVAHLEQLLEK
ncbi:universal stress protein UspA [Pseudomonas sp. G11-1]|uniref:Nucleotide-binding universal stress protein, UspA family n=1 Tax=Halopseudomonas bauzanensis TaxID=653930 RepID=A0A1I4ITB3_9GAMM|nr:MULTISPECIES: universal stress protein [Halopseudomonas]MCO5787576.1 universal stress protein UspA [Pseudomonas sp. G11-1]MCO5790693.1 universal stress protein UspA [Pseudomonas sp. G11-2]TKA91475.1 universal stress protein UspA [Halopseudomonas bauzanensis]WGK60173.1 universal stress protein [Halopseudomonas sp. SMJS2]SER72714.1 Nucleotide-binding universal stress protein, UspA family [Halopseudomonas bauzanensis]